jgi:hypothetical protein
MYKHASRIFDLWDYREPATFLTSVQNFLITTYVSKLYIPVIQKKNYFFWIMKEKKKYIIAADREW